MDLSRVSDIAGRLCVRKHWSAPKYIDGGASAAVYEVTTQTGGAALKIYDPSYFEGDNALIEAKRIGLQEELKGHDCPCLIDIYGAEELKEDGTWYLLMEYCPWRSLEKRLAEVPDEKIHPLLKQLVEAVKYLEGRGLVHRDIKPANIVVSNDFVRLKLLDFGVMRRVVHDEGSGTDGHKFIATAQYSPPEFLAREETPGQSGFAAINVYQVGAVLHDLITKTPLFGEEKATKNKFKLFKAVTNKAPRIVSAAVPPRLIAICLAALDKDPIVRARSVCLDDFLADVDDLNALRRRISRGPRGSVAPTSPPLSVWQAKVDSWGRDAAQLEVETLGPITMKAERLPDGHRWKMEFAAATAAIHLDLVRVSGGLAVYVSSAGERGPAIVVIGSDGPNVPETGIPGALAAQYLYALDRAQASHAPKEEPTP